MKIQQFREILQNNLLPHHGLAYMDTLSIGWSKRPSTDSSISGSPLRIGSQTFEHGWGDHANSRHRIHLPSPAIRFQVTVGPQAETNAPIRFVVEAPDGTVLASVHAGQTIEEPFQLAVELPELTDFYICAFDERYPRDFKGTPSYAHANWCDPKVTLKNGNILTVNDIKQADNHHANFFAYNGVKCTDIAFNYSSEIIEDTPELTRWNVMGTVPDGTLTLQNTVTLFHDFPVIEWLPTLQNHSDCPSCIVSDFIPLNLMVNLVDRSTGYIDKPVMHYSIYDVALRRTLGSKNMQSDFTEETVMLYPRHGKNHVRLDTDESRSSASWLPFFGLDITENEGLNIGIGWTGGWYADISLGEQPPSLMVKAGMPKTHFRVFPGETLRQVSAFVHFRDGMSVEDSQNQLRRFLLRHHSPHGSDGKPFRAPLSIPNWGGLPTQQMITNAQKIAADRLPVDVFWVDAGWFGTNRPVATSEFEQSDWASTVGNWRINQVPHPDGFKPVADEVHKHGMKFMLWFEMERVILSTPVAQEHPDWILKLPTNAMPGGYNPPNDRVSGLLDLGNDDARAWALKQVTDMVRNHGLDYYRQDFNFNPGPYWAANDAPDRQGVTEMKHIAGLYQFWDTLRKQFPDMLIDNCASGGRRIDFEMNSRSICLYRSDMLGRSWYDSSEASHIENTYLSRWVPVHGGGTTCVNLDDYGFLSGVAAGVVTHMMDSRTNFDAEWYRTVLQAAHRMMECFYGDMYLLTSCPESHRDIHAFQCDLPEENRGFFIAFRRPAGAESRKRLALRGIDDDATYELETFRGETKQCKGSAFSHFDLELPEPRSLRLVFYRKI